MIESGDTIQMPGGELRRVVSVSEGYSERRVKRRGNWLVELVHTCTVVHTEIIDGKDQR